MGHFVVMYIQLYTGTNIGCIMRSININVFLPEKSCVLQCLQLIIKTTILASDLNKMAIQLAIFIQQKGPKGKGWGM